MDPRAGLEAVEKILVKFLTLKRLELQPLCHPARSESAYLLRYPGSFFTKFIHNCNRKRIR
jgi:hypothetical protein